MSAYLLRPAHSIFQVRADDVHDLVPDGDRRMREPLHRISIIALLREHVLGRLHLGVLQPGDRLPSVRHGAREFGVDPRVVLAAYRDLEAEGLVELRARSGVFVARNAGNAATPSDSSRSTDRLIDQLAESLAAGVSAPMFLEQARRGLETRRLRAVVLDRNRDQLWSTSDELARDYGFEVDAVDVDTIRRRDNMPMVIRRADLLVSASSDAGIRAIATAANVPILSVGMCPDLFAEIRRILLAESVYFVVSDARFEAKLEGLLAPARGSHPIRGFVYGRDDLHRIPRAAPVYLTRLTREQMQRDAALLGHSDGDTQPERTEQSESDQIVVSRLLRRIMPDARVFSSESARELLTFVVRANLAVRAATGVPEIAFSG